MEQQKKRHNPPIHDEEHAVQAFDRNNDALPADSLEGKVKTSSVDIEKTEDAVKKEISKKFCDLVNEVFGSKNYSFNAAINIPAEFDYVGSILYTGQGERPVTINEHDLDLSKSIRLSAFEKPRWYQLTKSIILHVQVEVDLPDKTTEIEAGPLTIKSTFLEDNKYAPIKVYVRDTESLPKAKLFAQKYQEVTGQKARIIQDCPDEQKLEQKVEEKSKLDIAGKVTQLETKLFGLYITSGLGVGIGAGAIPSIIQKNYGEAAFSLGLASVCFLIYSNLKSKLVSEYEAELKRLSKQKGQ